MAVAVSLALPCAPLSAAAAAEKTRKKTASRRHVSKDKGFSILLPRGCRSERAEKSTVFRWVRPADKSSTSVFKVSGSLSKKHQGDAKTAARSSLKSRKSGKGKGWVFSKSCKKTLDNGMALHFYWYYPKRWKKPVRLVSGYFKLAGTLYKVSAKAPRKRGGLDPLLRILGTIKPIQRPKSDKQLLDPLKKPSFIKEQEKTAVPLY